MRFNKKDFTHNDIVWIAVGAPDLIDGRVVKVISKEEINYYEDHYVIEISSHAGEYLTIRPKSLTYDSKDVLDN
jgi:hypothetical protein